MRRIHWVLAAACLLLAVSPLLRPYGVAYEAWLTGLSALSALAVLVGCV